MMKLYNNKLNKKSLLKMNKNSLLKLNNKIRNIKI